MVMMLVLGVLSVVTVASAVAYQRNSRKALGPGSPLLKGPAEADAIPEDGDTTEERRLETLRLGDVISEGIEDWIVVGRVRYEEEDEEWFLYRVDNGRHQKWLEARQRNDWQAAWLEAVDDLPDFGQLADGFSYRERVLQLWRRGDARVQVAGNVAERTTEVIRYATYTGRGDELLCIETGAQRRALYGTRILVNGLMLMPGSASALSRDSA